MRMSMLAAGFLALCLPGAVHADEAEAVKAVEKLGGKVARDSQQPGEPVIGVDLSGKEVSDAGLKELKELKQLKELYLNGTKVRDAGLKELKDLKELTWLYLTDTKVSDAGLKQLKDLKQLTRLDLRGTKVTKEGVADLRKALPDCKITR